MNIDDAVRTVAERGFAEHQARFLVLVARDSGVCVMRQYSRFAVIVFGQKTRKFFAKLERLGWVSTYGISACSPHCRVDTEGRGAGAPGGTRHAPRR